MKENQKVMKPREYHLFNMHGDTLLTLPGGEIYILDDLARKILEIAEDTPENALGKLEGQYPRQAIEKAFMEMERVFANPPRDHSETELPRKLRALCLNVTHKCNLACDYCFAANLTCRESENMTPETLRAALDFLCRESGEIERLQVDFFGGEPLLVFPLITDGVAYARTLEKQYKKRFLFTLTTNALLLNESVLDFVKKENMSLILSLDGPREVHDLHRKTRKGEGSFGIIHENIKKAQEILEAKDFYIRGTYTAENLDIREILRYYLSEGFVNVSLEPVVTEENSPSAITTEHLEELERKYQEAARWLIGKPLTFFHFNLEMDNPLCLTRRITGCGAGVEYLAVDPTGNLYPCHQFIGKKEYLLGDVFMGNISPDLRESFRCSTIYTKQGCSSCWARFYCSGGCHYRQLIDTGNINIPSKLYCSMVKSRMEAALWYNIRRRILPT